MRKAPNAGGFFIGDYTGLDTSGHSFQMIYSQTTGSASNPTDMIAQRATGHAGPPADGSGDGVDGAAVTTGGTAGVPADTRLGASSVGAGIGRPVIRH